MDVAYAPAPTASDAPCASGNIFKRLWRRISKPVTLMTFWKVGGIALLVVLTFIIGNIFVPRDKAVTRQMLGHDFLAFYFAGTMARTGHYERLYDLGYTKNFEFTTGHNANLELGKSFGPWWNPPFAAWLFAPFTYVPYSQAVVLWWTFGLLCLTISIILQMRMLKGDWTHKGLVPLLMLTTLPIFQAFSHGQNTFFSLLLLTVVVTLWRARQAFWAGLICGLMFYKPQLGAIVALILCASQGRRAILGVGLTGTALLVINVLTMPGTLREFFYHMPVNLHWMLEENHYMWGRHITFKGFWRLLLQDHAEGPTAPAVIALWGICEAALGGALLGALVYTIRQPRSASRTDRLISAAIISMPLLMPFYFDYDLLLISVGAVLYGADRERTPAIADRRQMPWEDRWLPRVCILLYIMLEFGGVIGGHSRVQPIVPLLAVVAFLLIRRSLRPLTVADINAAVHGAAPLPIAA
jgi:glycosyl transferase family 87